MFKPHVSGHRLIFCTLADAQNPRRPMRLVNYRSLKGVDAEAMNVTIQAQPWSLLHAFDDVDDVVDTFYDLYRTAWDKFAPIKTKSAPKQHQQWMTHQITELMRERNKSYRKFCLNKTDENWIIYKGQRNRCISAIRTAKRSFLMDSARNNTANFWRQVKIYRPGKAEELPATVALQYANHK